MATAESDLPLVTLLVPLYQERRFIEALCGDLDAQTWPADRLEALFLDGGSTDGTRAFLAAHPFRCRARVVDNPRRVQVHALNLGLSLAAGEFLVRWDAHARYAPDYVERCVALLREEPGAVDGGGPMRAAGYDFPSSVVADLLNSPLGVGGARFRSATSRIEADTAFLGAFRRSVLLEEGGWDERFAVAEDMELAMRLRSRPGARILVDPGIRVSYFPRNRVAALARQYRRYGLYRLRLARVRRGALRPTHAFPLLLLPGLAGSLALGLSLPLAAGLPWGWLLLAPAVLYLLAAPVAAAHLARSNGRPPSELLRRTAYGALCLVAEHLSWSAGAWAGLLGPFRAWAAGPRTTVALPSPDAAAPAPQA